MVSVAADVVSVSLGGLGPAGTQTVCGRTESSAEGLLRAAGTVRLHAQTRRGRHRPSEARAIGNLVVTERPTPCSARVSGLLCKCRVSVKVSRQE